jgi:hypothetical protein
MKTIILNGCSWVAGDGIQWEQFLQENGYDVNDPELSWKYEGKRPALNEKLCKEYRLWRPQFNQGGMLKNELKTEVIDLSQDGNSNDNICMTTINQVLSIPVEDRHNYHVIVGWTIKERKLLHIKDWHWYNVHIAHVEQQSEKWEIHKPRIIGAILEETKHDWYLNYIKNVMFLETFLKLNKVSYTFYRSLGSTDEFYELDSKKVYNSFKINLTEVSDKNIILNNLLPSISDSANWLTFFEEEKHNSLASHSWTRYMQKTFTWQWHISADNKHPNIKATTMLVDIIKNHLIKNNLL